MGDRFEFGPRLKWAFWLTIAAVPIAMFLAELLTGRHTVPLPPGDHRKPWQALSEDIKIKQRP